MNGLRITSAFGVLTVATLALVGCASTDSPSDPDGRLPAGAGSLRDLSAGGVCEARESVTIGTSGASPIITGDCGSITVTGDKVSGNIETAGSVVVKGSDVTLLGVEWGSATVSGTAAGLNVDHIGTLRASGEHLHVTNRTLGTVTLDGDAAILNTDKIDDLTIAGDGSTVVVAGPIARLAVRGEGNALSWEGGADAPAPGSGNTYNR
ncbi:hypothetical protein JVX90_07325 [Gordonia sp. PDNC005]|uniref:hypothetical protein n=1 Tax=unclassified Gordonia (in: high G+C Gram-positive bacteria) TaxID=2657482 RepID=UPI0019663603|nr:hypothetical protein [Gordonia sp. PDNC005]QRY63989.1 hypothetical protein JVX90_07325 [Gordonia sp. PDNC005]